MTLPNSSRSLGARLAAAGLDWIVPDWPAPPQVCALSTTRNAGAGAKFDLTRSEPEFETARIALRRWLPADPIWLAQVHGIAIYDADAVSALGSRDPPEADGAVARAPNTVCAVHSADCLPVLLTNAQGSVVAAAHAGWRGLASGVLEATVDATGAPADTLYAWLGPAIGPRVYEVGEEVRSAIGEPAEAFTATRPGHWLLDLYAVARDRLLRRGVQRIYGGGFCTYSDVERFFSYRRDGNQRRMVAAIWLA
jgi:polyphenol oxidase